MTTDSEHIMPLLAGMDTVYFSCDRNGLEPVARRRA
jgi:hypothetical protein